VSALQRHVDGDCAGEMTCRYCSREQDLCERCDGMGETSEVYGLTAERLIACPDCQGTGYEGGREP
jgi:DnaJ-class molecular chaperone